TRGNTGVLRGKFDLRARPNVIDIGRCPGQLVNLEFSRKAFWLDTVHRAKHEAGIDTLPDRLAHQRRGAVILVEGFQPRGEVYRRSQDRVVHAVRRSDIADDGIADVQAEARVVSRPALALECSVELTVGLDAGEH